MIAPDDEPTILTDHIGGLFTDLGDAEKRPPEWVIEELIPVGLTLVGGPPKLAQKSFLTYSIALAVSGRPNSMLPKYLRRVARAGPVLWFAGEADAGTIRADIDAGIRGPSGERISIENDRTILVADDPFEWRLDEEDSVSRLMKWLREIDPRLVIFDPLSDFHMCEEKDAREMVQVLRPIRQWAVEHDGAVLVVHHTAKPGEGQEKYGPMNLRGSSALFGKADGILMVTPDKKDMSVKTVSATFKRGGAGWERVLRYGLFGQRAEEILPELAERTQKLVEGGAPSTKSISDQLHVNERVVRECIDCLIRNDLITKRDIARLLGGLEKRGTS